MEILLGDIIMTYIELYKKYRPRTWDDIIGQEATVKSLVTSIKENKLPTAFLFSGPRGCGKTTAALLLAKSLNCLQLQDGYNPCGHCDVCTGIDNHNQIGVTYFSAAQIKGVDEVREIVQQARMSVPIKKQVFIIDEIHSLSSKAFDALLIPIEEEKMPSLFIFCTTEIDRIPDPILSRVQSRKFSLVKHSTLVQYIQNICDSENISSINSTIIDTIVKSGRGSVRDTLSKLDEYITSGSMNSLSCDIELLKYLLSMNIIKAWKAIDNIDDNSGMDYRDLAETLFSNLRHVCITLATQENDKNNKDIVLISYEKLSQWSRKIAGTQEEGLSRLLRATEEIGNGIVNMNWGGDSRVHLELSLMKAIQILKGMND